MSRLSNWMRVALVDLRGDLRRFGILLACLALGTGTIAGVSSVGAALQQAIMRDANTLLGGNIEASRADRRADATELEYFRSLGQVAETMDSNARGDTASVEQQSGPVRPPARGQSSGVVLRRVSS